MDGQRQDGLQQAPHGLADEEPDPEAGGHAQRGDLDADEHRSDGQLPPRDSESHAHPDLALLGLDDATDQVERGQRGGHQHQSGQRVPEPLVVVDVLVEDAHGCLVLPGRDRGAQARASTAAASWLSMRSRAPSPTVGTRSLTCPGRSTSSWAASKGRYTGASSPSLRMLPSGPS